QDGAPQPRTRCQASASACASSSASLTSTTSAMEQRARDSSATNEDSQWQLGVQRGDSEKSQTAKPPLTTHSPSRAAPQERNTWSSESSRRTARRSLGMIVIITPCQPEKL